MRKISPPTGIRSPDCLARSESLYRLSYPGRSMYSWYEIQLPLPQRPDRLSVHPTSCSLGIWAPFPRGKAAEVNIEIRPESTLRMSGPITLLPPCTMSLAETASRCTYTLNYTSALSFIQLLFVNLCLSISIMSRLQARRPENRGSIFLYSPSRQALGPTQPSIRWLPETPSCPLGQSRRRAFTPSTAENKNWLVPLYVFTAYCLINL